MNFCKKIFPEKTRVQKMSESKRSGALKVDVLETNDLTVDYSGRYFQAEWP